jgi:hypothetical protein
MQAYKVVKKGSNTCSASLSASVSVKLPLLLSKTNTKRALGLVNPTKDSEAGSCALSKFLYQLHQTMYLAARMWPNIDLSMQNFARSTTAQVHTLLLQKKCSLQDTTSTTLQAAGLTKPRKATHKTYEGASAPRAGTLSGSPGSAIRAVCKLGGQAHRRF